MLLVGDCVEQMKTLEANSVDAIVTDPPYGIGFMGKGWDNFGGAAGTSPELREKQRQEFSRKNNRTPLWSNSGKPAKASPDERMAFQKFSEQWAREAYRVLKPGGHLLAFGGTRMYHRLAAGIEDAGFEIRDTLMWVYGSGFPKSLDVSKAIDKAAGAEREVAGFYQSPEGTTGWKGQNKTGSVDFGASRYEDGELRVITAPSTEAAKKWQGWGTALKPAVEPIVLARKPLIGTVAENVLTHGTGALNIDASRIGTSNDGAARSNTPNSGRMKSGPSPIGTFERSTPSQPLNPNIGRWPANILLDEEAAAMLDEQSGGASRFFYVAKAGRAERNFGLGRNIHPTVKPVDLMRYLIRLVTPKGGTVLDPFMGSGTTAVAAIQEGANWIGCEREQEYVAIIEARIAAAQPGMGLNLEEDTQ